MAEMAQRVIKAVEQLRQPENYWDNVVDVLFNALLANREMCVWFMNDQKRAAASG